MSRYTPLPQDLQKAFGHLRYLKYKGNGEWSSECPECHDSGHNQYSGDPDRFHIHASSPGKDNARGICRQCGVVVFATNNTIKAPSPAKLQEMQDKHEQQQELEAAQLQSRLDTFMASKLWEFYHQEMTERERWLWEKSGIPNEYQDLWKLGYMKHYPSKQFNSDALTIPYFESENSALNIQYRLLQPPQVNNKYRFTRGLPSTLWLPEPDRPLTGVCLLLEGMKKAAVTYIKVAGEAEFTDYTIIAVPSAASYGLLAQLSTFDEVIVAFDPDQYKGKRDVLGAESPPPITKVLDKIDAPIIRLAKFPTKIDDFFHLYGGTYSGFTSIIDQSYQYKPGKRYAV